MKENKRFLGRGCLYALFCTANIVIMIVVIILLEWFLIYHCQSLSASQKVMLSILILIIIPIINGKFLEKIGNMMAEKNPLYKDKESSHNDKSED